MVSRFASPPEPPIRSTWSSKNDAKRELMAAARSMGWKGKTYRKAKRFDRMLTRLRREAFRPSPESVGSRVRRTVARFIKRGGK